MKMDNVRMRAIHAFSKPQQKRRCSADLGDICRRHRRGKRRRIAAGKICEEDCNRSARKNASMVRQIARRAQQDREHDRIRGPERGNEAFIAGEADAHERHKEHQHGQKRQAAPRDIRGVFFAGHRLQECFHDP
jgi:hypothetical protein